MRASAFVSGDFRGFYYTAARETDRCMIVLLGDDGDDFMSKLCAKWLTRAQNCHALCLALRRSRAEDPGISRWPLEQAAHAVRWLLDRGISKIGIMGMSMQGAMALSAAARIPEFSLTLALSPCDFVPWGFCHGRKKEEFPTGASAFSWQGQDLPFQPPMLEPENYWLLYQTATKAYHEMHSRTLFDLSEEFHPVSTEALIPVENIPGKLVLVGAEDDSMWDAAKYIRRMEVRLGNKTPAPALEALIYPYGTHLLVPQKMLDLSLPPVGNLVSRMFVSGRRYPAACKAARLDLEEKLTAVFEAW